MCILIAPSPSSSSSPSLLLSASPSLTILPHFRLLVHRPHPHLDRPPASSSSLSHHRPPPSPRRPPPPRVVFILAASTTTSWRLELPTRREDLWSLGWGLSRQETSPERSLLMPRSGACSGKACLTDGLPLSPRRTSLKFWVCSHGSLGQSEPFRIASLTRRCRPGATLCWNIQAQIPVPHRHHPRTGFD